MVLTLEVSISPKIMEVKLWHSLNTLDISVTSVVFKGDMSTDFKLVQNKNRLFIDSRVAGVVLLKATSSNSEQ